MTRQLRPCGTRSAYKRHLYNNETPCDACKAANRVETYSGMNGYEIEMAKALAKNPPVIRWVKNRRGVFEAVEVRDPHTDNGHRYGQPECIRGHAFDEENTIVRPDGRECRKCKRLRDQESWARRQHDDTPLMAAARSEL